MQFTYILFGIYGLVVLGIIAFCAAFALHYKKQADTIPHFWLLFQITMSLVILIAAFGAYKIFTSPSGAEKPSFNFNIYERIDY